MRFLAVLLAAISFIVLPVGGVAQQPSSTDSNAEKEVRQAAQAFIHAFDNLDWDTFRACFSDDATVFFPMPGIAERATGRSEVEGFFRSVFDEVRRRMTGPPYLNLDPKDTHIQILQDAAVVTFHLEGPELLNRRSRISETRGAVAHCSPSCVGRVNPSLKDTWPPISGIEQTRPWSADRVWLEVCLAARHYS